MTAQDWTVVIGSIATALVLVIAAVGRVLVQVQATHNLVNSRMTELLELTRTSARAEGKLESATDSDKRTQG